MAAFQHCLGPIDLYIRNRVAGVTNNNWLYLGTAVSAPEFEIKPAYINIMNDLGGRSVPFQKVKDGEQWIVTSTLNRFDYSNYNQLKVNTTQTANIAAGESIVRGRLYLASDDYMALFIFNYKNTVADIGNMPAGRMFYSMTPLAFRESTVGTRVNEVTIVMEMNAVFDVVTRSFPLYTENPSAFGSYSYT